MSNPSRVMLVTGASGFLGTTIVGAAKEAGWRVRAFDRCPSKTADGIEQFVGDIGDAELLRKACKSVSVVLHAAGLAHVMGAAAKNAALFNTVNETGTKLVVEAAVECGVPHVVLVSSVSVYGEYMGALCDESAPCKPKGPYAISKWRSEQVAAEGMASGSGALTILRFATMYGEGDRGNVARLIRAIDRGHFLWLGTGENRKSMLYKQDAARACLAAAMKPARGIEIFNVSARPVPMREIVIAICQALGRPTPRYGIPRALLNIAGQISSRIGDPLQLARQVEKFLRDDAYDGSKFEAAYNFTPAISLAEGIHREVGSLQSAK